MSVNERNDVISYEENEKFYYIQSSVIAYNDYANIIEGQSIVVNILNNDIGLNEGVASLDIIVSPENGNVVVNNDYSITYTPDQGYYGEDFLTYKVCNVSGGCDEANVNIDISNEDFTPIAVNDTIIYNHGTSTGFDILSNDTIYGDYPIQVTIIQSFIHGEAELDEDFMLIPVFGRNFGGLDSLKYAVCDADNDCDEAWVFVDVQSSEGMAYFIPNGFSPNGDGFNDVFYIPDFRSYTNIHLTIFNEWGQLVYENVNYQNDWNGDGNSGAYNGKRLVSGTYYFIFRLQDESKPITGSIYLSR